MQKVIIAFSLSLAFIFHATPAEALSCLPVDMYLDTVIGDETTQIFIGTATDVKEHTQVVTVTKALQSRMAPQVWVQHPYSKDWKYFCSNGPAKKGESTIFFTTIDAYGSYSVVQTLSVNSDIGKDFLKKIEGEEIDAGITEATPTDRASEMRQSIIDLIKALINMLTELRYWESVAAK